MSKTSKIRQSQLFVSGEKVETETVGEGVFRKILGYDNSILMAHVRFEEGSIGYTHAHPHAQVAYVESGAFDFTVGEETRRLEAGDCAYMPPGIEHGAVCVEAGVLIDVFSPAREDFLTEDETA